jgi:hypothetical protein
MLESNMDSPGRFFKPVNRLYFAAGRAGRRRTGFSGPFSARIGLY